MTISLRRKGVFKVISGAHNAKNLYRKNFRCILDKQRNATDDDCGFFSALKTEIELF